MTTTEIWPARPPQPQQMETYPLGRPAPRASGHRLDIQGLRALAVVVVVAYHAGVPGISGGFIGVDLFFVLSGYLIIGLMAAEVAKTGKISLSNFWARRARRLLPASILVIATTLFISSKVYGFFERKEVATDAIWATLFGANWRFAQQDTDYLAADRDPSPLLHFWSLGVEEQFYMVAPLFFVLVSMLMWFKGKRHPRRVNVFPRSLVATTLSLVIVSSLAYSVHLSSTNQPYAFFGTHSRAWQLAAGGLLAVVLPVLPAVGRGLGTLLSVVGLAMFTACALLLSEGGQVLGLSYPSYLAVGPTVAGLLLLAGGSGAQTPVGWMLSLRPLTFVGDISYSLYLWHWPALILGVAYLDDDRLATKLLLVGFSVLAAIVTFTAVEDPIRSASWLKSRAPAPVSVALGAALVVSVLPFAWSAANTTFDNRVVTATSGVVSASDSIANLSPALDKAPEDRGPMVGDGCQIANDDAELPEEGMCDFGSPGGKRRVFLIGDSIAGASFGGADKAAKKEGWALTVWAKSGCSLADITVNEEDGKPEWKQCSQWREKVISQMVERKPDLVIMANAARSHEKIIGPNGRIEGSEADEKIEKGLSRTIARMQDAGVKVALIESPHVSPESIPSCLIESGSVKKCSFEAGDEDRHSMKMREQFKDLIYLEMNSLMCQEGTCSPVVGRTVTLRDEVHFTATFSESLSSLFRRALEIAV